MSKRKLCNPHIRTIKSVSIKAFFTPIQNYDIGIVHTSSTLQQSLMPLHKVLVQPYLECCMLCFRKVSLYLNRVLNTLKLRLD